MPHVDRRTLLALIALGLALAALAARLLGLGPAARARDAPAATAPIAAASTAADPVPALALSADRIVVHVVGAVRRPGVYRLARGARGLDAVRAAGGATRRADLAGLNLAAALVDGEQVAVPRRGDAVVGTRAGAATAPGPPAVIHLNGADAAALESLPGIGPATAARILAWRAENGGFEGVDDLLEVPGIGEARVEALRGLVAP